MQKNSKIFRDQRKETLKSVAKDLLRIQQELQNFGTSHLEFRVGLIFALLAIGVDSTRISFNDESYLRTLGKLIESNISGVHHRQILKSINLLVAKGVLARRNLKEGIGFSVPFVQKYLDAMRSEMITTGGGHEESEETEQETRPTETTEEGSEAVADFNFDDTELERTIAGSAAAEDNGSQETCRDLSSPSATHPRESSAE